MAEVNPPRPLAEADERAEFDCGRPAMNVWFQRHAWANHAGGFSRITVLTTRDTARIAGYVTLSAAQIERAWLPKSQQRNRPDPVPVTLLGQLAVDKQFQGQGHASSLLLYALKTALVASQAIGSAGVITHPIDDAMRTFYAKWGFADLPFDPRHAMILRMTDVRITFGASP